MRKRPSSFRARVSILIAVFFAAVFSVPAFRTGDAGLWTLAAAVPGAMLLMLLLPSRIIRLDRPSLSLFQCHDRFAHISSAYIVSNCLLHKRHSVILGSKIFSAPC